MKKLIGVIAILLTLLLCVVYRQLTRLHAKAKPETVYVPETIQDGLFLTTLMMQ
jgi:hypothetical protein